jgi:DNA-binding response OmpR family regulator
MKNILIVDDDTVFQKTMKDAFEAKEYTVVSALDGMEGMKKIEETKPDLILLDIMMPAMNGLQFLHKVNEKYGQGVVPVVITSNTSSIDNISAGVSMGIRSYIVKSNESVKNIVDAAIKILS